MELNPQEQIDGRCWFFGAGLAAVLFSFFLVFVDYKLSHSDRELRVRDDLYELRSAQFGLGSRSSDAREKGEVPHAALPAVEAAHHDSHDIHDSHEIMAPPAVHDEHAAADDDGQADPAPADSVADDSAAADAEHPAH